MRYSEIGFWDGDFGSAVVDVLHSTHGPTVESVHAVVTFLSQWDCGDNDNVVADYQDRIGTSDDVFRFEGYVLTANFGLGYVSLYFDLDTEGYNVSECVICGEPMDYCLGGHTDSDYDDAECLHAQLMAELETATEGL